jgi:hypothetical protein
MQGEATPESSFGCRRLVAPVGVVVGSGETEKNAGINSISGRCTSNAHGPHQACRSNVCSSRLLTSEPVIIARRDEATRMQRARILLGGVVDTSEVILDHHYRSEMRILFRSKTSAYRTGIMNQQPQAISVYCSAQTNSQATA